MLYGIWLIDGISGLLLAHASMRGFSFDPHLFSGFVTAIRQFARQASGGELRSIAMGNFKLLIHQRHLVTVVLAVSAGDPDDRYTGFIHDLEAKVDPILTREHHKPGGLMTVTEQLRSQLAAVIEAELERFTTRNAPSDLSTLTVLRDPAAKRLLRALLERRAEEIAPELTPSLPGFTYPLATAITGLPEEEAARLLEKLASYGLLLSEPMDTAICCPNCGSIHIHPRILCSRCGAPVRPADLYEHLRCGYVGLLHEEEGRIRCARCGATGTIEQGFRRIRGFYCSKCSTPLLSPRILFRCHQCREILAPERGGVRVISKYRLNPALTGELHTLLLGRPKRFRARRGRILDRLFGWIKRKPRVGRPPIPEEKPEPEVLPSEPAAGEEGPSILRVEEERQAILHELEELERKLSIGEITDAEYDRRFVKLRLRLRELAHLSSGEEIAHAAEADEAAEAAEAAQ